jgi:hypothetical protein
MGRTLIGAALAAVVGGAMGHAAEIKVISANGMREVIAETKAKFEVQSGLFMGGIGTASTMPPPRNPISPSSPGLTPRARPRPIA